MEVHLRDILISRRFADFSFANPVPIKWNQDGIVVGAANLKSEKDNLIADLVIQDHIKYEGIYPHLAVDVISKTIGYLYLSENKSIDADVKPLKEQLLPKK